MLIVIVDKYQDYGHCESTLSADNLLSQYENDRNAILEYLRDDPNYLVKTTWKEGSLLAIDNQCQCQMGKGNIRTKFICAQCKNLRRLIDFNKSSEPFQIECGKFSGKTMIVSKVDVTAPNLSWNDEVGIRAGNYIKQYQNVTMCGTPNMQGKKYITGDCFTIRTFIMWILHHHLNKKGLPHIPNLRSVFICNNIGYSLYDAPSIGNIKTLETRLTSPIVKDIILQLLVIFTELSSMNFSHGNPSSKGILFSESPVSYKYNGRNIISPITVQIADMWNSSLTFNDVHYYPKNISPTIEMEKNFVAPEISTKVGEETGDNFYRLNNDTMNIYNTIRHIGFPLYVGSFDFYCFMVSLMCNRYFYYYVVTDGFLSTLWSSIWLREDINNVNQRIQVYHTKEVEGRSNHNPVDIIKGLWLRCNVLNYVWGKV